MGARGGGSNATLPSPHYRKDNFMITTLILIIGAATTFLPILGIIGLIIAFCSNTTSPKNIIHPMEEEINDPEYTVIEQHWHNEGIDRNGKCYTNSKITYKAYKRIS